MMMPDDVRKALEAYRKDQNASTWTTLSQLWVGEVQVLDALQRLDPNFPDPLPLNVDGVLTDSSEFYQWEQLPDPDEVNRALEALG